MSEDGQIPYRRGMVLVAKDRQIVACWRLEARVALFNACGPQLTPGFQTMVWCGNVCQTAVVERVLGRSDEAELNVENSEQSANNVSSAHVARICTVANVRFIFSFNHTLFLFFSVCCFGIGVSSTLKSDFLFLKTSRIRRRAATFDISKWKDQRTW